MKTVHDELRENPEFRKLSAIEDLCGGAADLIAKVMQEQSVSKADLARKMNKSRSWVTQLLGGEANMTVRTLAEVLYHLDKEVSLTTKPLRGTSLTVPKRGESPESTGQTYRVVVPAKDRWVFRFGESSLSAVPADQERAPLPQSVEKTDSHVEAISPCGSNESSAEPYAA